MEIEKEIKKLDKKIIYVLNKADLVDVKNPGNVVEDLMSSDAKAIERFYKIDIERDGDVLIEKLGKKKGFLVKGGEVDVDRTARLILRDWQEEKIGKGKGK